MKNKPVLFLTQAAMIAALYVVLTMVSSMLGLANQAIQVRFSEALTILPFFLPAAIPGLFLGCLISNLFAGGILLDVILGSIATLIGAFGTYLLRGWVHRSGDSHRKASFAGRESIRGKGKLKKLLLPVPPIVSNTILVPLVLKYGYGNPALLLNSLTVCLGELISCGVFGLCLLRILEKQRLHLFSSF